MHSSITRALALAQRPFEDLTQDNHASTAVIAVAGVGTITIGGLLAWFFVGSVMMSMPGIIGFMGFLAVVLAIGLTVWAFVGRGG